MERASAGSLGMTRFTAYLAALSGGGFMTVAGLRFGDVRVGERPRRGLERLKGFLLFLLDGEEPVELGDLEDLVDLGVDVAQDEPALDLLQFRVEFDELAQ